MAAAKEAMKTLHSDARVLASAEIFVHVVETGGFSTAAKVLQLTQSGVSRSIARLEQRLGHRLLHRHARALHLTEEGNRFFQAVEPLVLGLREAVEASQSASTSRTGLIRVGVDAPFGRFVLAPRIGAFLEREPGVRIELLFRPQLGDLVADKLDLIIRFGRPTMSGLITRKLFETRVLTYASPAYLARYGTPRVPSDLATQDHQCILLINAETGRPYTWDFIRGNDVVRVKPTSRLLLADPSVRVAACRGGAGIAQLLEVYARPYSQDGSLVQVLEDWADETWPLFAYLPTRHQVSARVRAFLDFVVEIVGRAS